MSRLSRFSQGFEVKTSRWIGDQEERGSTSPMEERVSAMHDDQDSPEEGKGQPDDLDHYVMLLQISRTYECMHNKSRHFR